MVSGKDSACAALSAARARRNSRHARRTQSAHASAAPATAASLTLTARLGVPMLMSVRPRTALATTQQRAQTLLAPSTAPASLVFREMACHASTTMSATARTRHAPPTPRASTQLAASHAAAAAATLQTVRRTARHASAMAALTRATRTQGGALAASRGRLESTASYASRITTATRPLAMSVVSTLPCTA